MSKEKFIKFVRANPNLVDYVRKNNTSWQNLYEVYSIYGESSEVWNKYLNNKENSINELVHIIKSVNLESIRKVVDGLQKTISLVQDIGGTQQEEVYQKRQMYEDLDD